VRRSFVTMKVGLRSTQCVLRLTAETSSIRTYEIPEKGIHSDNALAETGDFTEFERVRKYHLIPRSTSEPYSPWMNRAERKISKLKTHWRSIMNRHQCPDALWCFGLEYRSDIQELMARNNLEGRTPLEVLTGSTPDISEYTEFDFYQLVMYYNPNNTDEAGIARRKLGRWLGPSKHVGQALCYYELKSNSRYVARSTVRPIVADDFLKHPTLKEEMVQFDNQVKEHVGSFDNELIRQTEPDDPEETTYVADGQGNLPTDEDMVEDPDDWGF
jgi:hypothetical protein